MLLEREFSLCWHVPGFNLGDLRKTDSKILDWYWGRLVKQKHDDLESK